MKIKFMRRMQDSGSLRAYFTLDYEGVDYNGMKLMVSGDGKLFAAPPSRRFEKDGQTKFENYYYFRSREVREEISRMARAEYLGGAEPQDEPDVPF